MPWLFDKLQGKIRGVFYKQPIIMACLVKKMQRKLEKISAKNLILDFSGNTVTPRIVAIALKIEALYRTLQKASHN